MSLLPEISQASAEINKLVAQANIHQTIAPVDPAAFTDPADTMLLASRDPVIREVSVGMTGVEAAPYTVSGTPPLSLPNSLGKPLKAWSVDLLPYQEGTGDPSPDNVRLIHGTDKLTITTAGKNLFDSATCLGGKGFVEQQDGSWYIAANGSIPTDIVIWQTPIVYSGRMTIRLSYKNLSATASQGGRFKWKYSDGTTATIYLPVTVDYVELSNTSANNKNVVALVWDYGSSANSTWYKDVQVEFGTTASDFVPYLAPSQTVITLPQTVYTGTIGSEGGESRWGEVDLGTLTWTVSGYYYVSTALNDAKAPPSVNVAPNMLAEYAAVIALNPMTASSVAIGMLSGKRLYTPTAMWENAPIGKLVYELEVATYFAVTTPSISTPSGTATTWATAEDGTVESMEVTYVGNA